MGTIEDRHQRLADAAGEYARGEITAEELEAVEDRYITDYRLSALELANALRQAKRRAMLLRILRRFRLTGPRFKYS